MMAQTVAASSIPVRGAYESDGLSPCGCRKLVRTRDLRLCPSGGHAVMDLRNYAIHPNRPVADLGDRDRYT
jgi:hypothetical protein